MGKERPVHVAGNTSMVIMATDQHSWLVQTACNPGITSSKGLDVDPVK